MKPAFCALALVAVSLTACATAPETPVAVLAAPTLSADSTLDERIAYYAQVYEVPETLVRRSIARESGFDPKKHAGPYWGLMQIRLDTARGVGYRGPARGLLDADANLKYAVAYLANAYKVSGGNEDRALRLYAGGYYYEARRKGLLDQLTKGREE